MADLSAPDLYQRLSGPAPPRVLDVRNAEEFARWRVEGPHPLDTLNVPYFEFVEKEDEIGPAIERAYASGKTAVVHVCIDPTANSEEMPKYDRFRTWYAEGTQ